jgi:predicted unusual protein kinase regulating ubiquinone biosynthesis (AarF/ABC1/UbiB family)
MSEDKEISPGRMARAAEATIASAMIGVNLLRPGGSPPLESAARLSRMRGLAAKLGQLLSYVDGLVPDDSRDAMRTAFAALTDATHTSPAAAIRATIEQEFALPVDQLFEQWDDRAVASASVGQVHRAVFRGAEVAVKVQHPGIAEAIEADLANATLLQVIASKFLGGQLGAAAMMQELAEGFRAEIDYCQEAANVRRFQDIHAGDSSILIPDLIPERCSRRVLTTVWVSGLPLSAAAEAGAETRADWCKTLWRFAFRALLRHGTFNADPHPGNFFFQPNGSVAFVDFGCCRSMSESRWRRIVDMHAAALRRDMPEFRAAVTRMLDLQPGRLADLSFSFVDCCLRPVVESPFRVTTEYSAGLVHAARAFTSALRGMEKNEVTPQPAELIFLNRLHFGFYSVLAQLDSEVDYATVEGRLI